MMINLNGWGDLTLIKSGNWACDVITMPVQMRLTPTQARKLAIELLTQAEEEQRRTA